MTIETQFDKLLDGVLDEVLFYYFTNGDATAEQAEPTLDATVRTIAKREGFSPSDEDVKAVAALAYEQLSAR